MTDDLQRALKTTLKAASLDAPQAAPDLLDQLAGRARARRRNRATMAVAAVTTALLVTAGTSAALRAGNAPGSGALSGKNAGGLPTETVPSPVPVPRAAVRTEPDTLPNGRRYNPEVALDGTSLLVSTESRPDVIDQLWVYDLQDHQATKVTDVVEPGTSTQYAGNLAAGDGQAVWSQEGTVAGRAVTEIWAAPLTGGNARRVVSLDAGSKEAGIGRLVVGGGTISWSRAANGGAAGTADDEHGSASGATAVYEVPLAGGPVRIVPGTDGYRILSWPWIGTPGTSSGRAGDADFKRLWNLATGQTRTVRLPKSPNTWTCWISWCVGGPPLGVTLDRVPDTRVLPLAAGTGRAVPADELPVSEPPEGSLMYDRFLSLANGDKRDTLYDLATGRMMDLGPTYEDNWPVSIPSARRDGSTLALDRYLVRPVKGAIQIIDLAAVE
ncbi:hypothetical protein ACFYTC_19065 [Actinomadura nitritigenes]|uniref:hypothetical protein n=1 Tax=Actinomadura nitritigenes TaxID=134602 RepID=UPI003674C652